ncbi:hypothetical protein F5Y16DRAFT_423508 [Xylariaceae sp. FL0255]|nr:hypothetical protein F5Y16DRAFT_423508 [Xylariaceae sp. FL0255]
MDQLQPGVNHHSNPFKPHPELGNVKMPTADYANDSDAFGIFAARGMAPPKILRPDEVRREAKQRCTNIFANFHILQRILERTIQKRWEKKTRTQRISILLQFWPDMPQTHRPDFAAFRKHAGNLNSVAIQYRSSFIWPIINQEDLGDTKTLPLLINSRGRNHPSVFAAFDGELMHLGKTTMAIVPVYLNEHVMILNGVTQEESYGKLIAWDEHEDAFDWMHTRKQFLPGEGLFILEFQERLLRFLVDCCKTILHDIPFQQMTSNRFAIQPEPPVKESKDTTGFASLAILAKEAPYRVPSNLDLERIESLLSARTSKAEDHFWSLREDPSYFAETDFEIKEHRLEMLKDVRGDTHPATKFPHDDLIWARVLGSVLVDSFFDLESYTELRNQANHLRKLSSEYSPELSPQKDLPEEYLSALLKFRHYLNQVVKGVLARLKSSMVASPPLRTFFVREVPTSFSSSIITVTENSRNEMNKVTRELIWLLRTLWEDGYTLFLCRMTIVIDELDRLLKSESKASELVSPYVAMLIGDLSILGECLRQLEIFQAWANGFENALVDRETDIKEEFENRTTVWAQVLNAFTDKICIGLRPAGDPSGGKFQYPVGKPRTRANVEVLRKSEANLDYFWSEVDVILYKNVRRLNSTAYKLLFAQSRRLQRTPEWLESTAKNEKSEEGHDQDNASFEYVRPFTKLFRDTKSISSVSAEALAVGARRTKVKRRGVGTESMNKDYAVLHPANSPDIQPTFEVDARALKVFRIVFFDPAANTTAGEVPWRDFLHAMSSTGFTAQKLYGSVWHFQPTRLEVERSIQFHEPHPRGKIPFLVARRHGRRLNRAYGWDGDMFILKDKTKTSI